MRVRLDAWVQAATWLATVGHGLLLLPVGLDWMPSPWGRGEDDPTEPPPQRTTEVKQGYAGGETRFQVFARFYSTS